MATFDGERLPLDRSGTVVLLTRPPGVNWVERFSDDVEVRLSTQSRGVIVVEPNSRVLLEELSDRAREAANRALDLIAVRSGGSFTLADPTSPRLCWTTTPAGVVMRLLVEVSTTFSMRVGGGPTAYPLAWHESMRYFRMSQTTADLFDAFRNLYLALESLLSHIAPVRQRSNGRYESDAEWLRRALEEADATLRRHNSEMTIGRHLASQSADEAAAVFAELYTSIRTSIFHAKNSRPFVLPQAQQSRTQIADALARYVVLYADLAEAIWGARFLRSGLAVEGFAAMANAILPTWVVGFSDLDFSNIKDFDAQTAANLACLPTTRDPDHDGPFQAAVVGVAKSVDQIGLAAIRSVAARNTDGEPVMVEPLNGRLSIDGVDQVECRLTFHVQSSGAKSRYDT